MSRTIIEGVALPRSLIVLVFIFYALVSASLLAINMPPYQNADETNHLLRADNLLRGHLFGRRLGVDGGVGGIAAPEIARSGAAFDWPKFHPERKVTDSEYAAAAAKFGQAGLDIVFPNTAIYPPPFYVPTILALQIGKTTRLGVVETLYLARLLTALASGLLIASAISMCAARGEDGAALFIFVVATLPMSLSMQSAVSQDGPMLGVAALAAALVVRLRRTPSTPQLWGLCACSGLLAMARPAYIALALLPLAAKVRPSLRLLAAGLAASICLVWVFATSYGGDVAMANSKADMSAQMAILSEPVRLVRLLWGTITANEWSYTEQIIGRLGWLDVALPTWYLQITAAALATTIVMVVRPFSWGGLVVVAAAAGSAIGVMLLIYFSWTGVGRPLIEGVQGRYFLPLLMVVGGLGASLGRSMLWFPARLALLLWPVVSIGVTMRALVTRYYLGP